MTYNGGRACEGGRRTLAHDAFFDIPGHLKSESREDMVCLIHQLPLSAMDEYVS